MARGGQVGSVSDDKTYPGAGRFVPGEDASLAQVAKAAQDCQGR